MLDFRSQLQDKLKSSFSSTYLTLTSIIQGVTVAYFASTLDKIDFNNHVELLMAITTAILLIAVWNEYMMGANALVWMPTLIDSFIPFVLGGIEIYLIHAIFTSPAGWLFGMFVFALGAFAAFINLHWQAAHYHDDDNKQVLEALGLQLHFAWIYCIISTIFFFGLYYYSALILHGKATELGVSSILAVFIGFLVRAVFYWRSIVRYANSKIPRAK